MIWSQIGPQRELDRQLPAPREARSERPPGREEPRQLGLAPDLFDSLHRKNRIQFRCHVAD
jgi:hypothetical protein